MASENQKKDRWEKLKTQYRLNIMNNETFEEIGSYKLSLMNIYVLLCTLLFLGAGLVLLLVLFTPIKKWIPGYQDVRYNAQYLRMERKVQEMEKILTEYKVYTDKLAKIVTVVPDSGEETPSRTEDPPAAHRNYAIPSSESSEVEISKTEIQEDFKGVKRMDKETSIQS